MSFWEFFGIKRCRGFLKDPLFYIAVALALVFYGVLMLTTHHLPFITSKPVYKILVSQLFLVAFPEEFFFRGFLIPFIREYIPSQYLGISMANIISAVIFAGLHILYHPFLWAVGTFFPAILFGYFREKHDCLWPAVVLHYIYNVGYFILF